MKRKYIDGTWFCLPFPTKITLIYLLFVTQRSRLLHPNDFPSILFFSGSSPPPITSHNILSHSQITLNTHYFSSLTVLFCSDETEPQASESALQPSQPCLGPWAQLYPILTPPRPRIPRSASVAVETIVQCSAFCVDLSFPTIWTDWHIPLLSARLTVFGAFERSNFPIDDWAWKSLGFFHS